MWFSLSQLDSVSFDLVGDKLSVLFVRGGIPKYLPQFHHSLPVDQTNPTCAAMIIFGGSNNSSKNSHQSTQKVFCTGQQFVVVVVVATNLSSPVHRSIDLFFFVFRFQLLLGLSYWA